MNPVKTKKDFVRRYSEGEFGNASPTWNGWNEFWADWKMENLDKLYHIRNRIAGGPTYYDVEGGAVGNRWSDLLAKGVTADSLYISEMAPTHLTLIQGEVRRSVNHLDLYYSQYVAPMRESLLKGGQQVYGLKAGILLKHFLNTSSYEWLNYLLDEYEDHVVEFSTYAKCWGTVPRMNTVFWEVRLY